MQGALDSGLTLLAKGVDSGVKAFKSIVQGPSVLLTVAGRCISSKCASGAGLGRLFQEKRVGMRRLCTPGWDGAPSGGGSPVAVAGTAAASGSSDCNWSLCL